MASVGRTAAAFLLTGALAACAAGPAGRVGSASGDRAPRAVIVSWDGAKASAVRELMAQGRLPVLRGLKRHGAWTFEARTIVPSLTLPSHVSMMTGVGPGAHGVTWNRYEPERGPVAARTVFEEAQAAGLRSVLVAGKEKFRHLVKPGAPGRFELVDSSADAAARAAVRLVGAERTDLLVLHLRPADDAGHDYGWGDRAAGVPPSPQYTAALEECDAATGRLVAALRKDGRWRETLLIVTADHGGRGDNHGGASDDEVLIPWVAAGGLVRIRGRVAAPVNQVDTPATALEALGVPVPAAWEGRPVAVLRAAPLRRAA